MSGKLKAPRSLTRQERYRAQYRALQSEVAISDAENARWWTFHLRRIRGITSGTLRLIPLATFAPLRAKSGPPQRRPVLPALSLSKESEAEGAPNAERHSPLPSYPLSFLLAAAVMLALPRLGMAALIFLHNHF